MHALWLSCGDVKLWSTNRWISLNEACNSVVLLSWELVTDVCTYSIMENSSQRHFFRRHCWITLYMQLCGGCLHLIYMYAPKVAWLNYVAVFVWIIVVWIPNDQTLQPRIVLVWYSDTTLQVVRKQSANCNLTSTFFSCDISIPRVLRQLCFVRQHSKLRCVARLFAWKSMHNYR